MKKIIINLISLLLLVGLYSCEKDDTTTINPDAESGDLSFELNQPKHINYTYLLDELKNDLSMDTLKTSQPNYGFTAAVTYYVQASFTEDMADNVELATSVQGASVPINTKDMNKAILALYKGVMPNPTVKKDVFIRLKAVISEATTTPLNPEPTVKPLYSNAVKLNIMPYFMEDLVSYENAKNIVSWYIVGLGDGNWTNEPAGVGSSLYPMSVASGNWFDSDGNGKFVFTNYFKAGEGFKVIRDPGSWDLQWGNGGGDGIDNPVYKDGGSGNFSVPADGYYTVTLNSVKEEMKIEKADITPDLYATMGVVGEMTGWDGTPDVSMQPFQTDNNHLWYVEYTYEADSETKFRANSEWGSDWGGTIFPVGLVSGDNINAKKGTYMILFNDIDGYYNFYKK